MFGKLVTDFILFKLFMAFFQFCKLLAIFAFCLIIVMSSNRYKPFFESESFATKIGYSMFENVRYNLRIIIGSFIPLDPTKYHDLSGIDKATLPDPKKAAFKFDSHQMQGLTMIRMESHAIEDIAVQLYKESKRFYYEHGWNNIRSYNHEKNTEIQEKIM